MHTVPANDVFQNTGFSVGKTSAGGVSSEFSFTELRGLFSSPGGPGISAVPAHPGNY